MFNYKTQKEIAELDDNQVETYAKELKAHEADLRAKEIETAVEAVKTSLTSEIAKATQANVDLEVTVKELKDANVKPAVAKTLEVQLKESKDTIKSIAKGADSEIVLKANLVRASITNNTQGYELPDVGQLAHRKLTAYDLFRRIPVSESNNQGVIKYWDWDSATTVRAAAAIAEGGTFPQSTAKFVEYTLPLQKIGDTLPVSEEFFEDEAMFAAELNMFLDTNVAIKVDTDLITGNGTAPNIKGLNASVDAYTPVASGITDASIYDLLIKVSESITATGGSKYTPDFALMNISDINKMRLKKDANFNYVMPPFVTRDGAQVDNMVVLECNAVTANTMVVGDRRYARIYEKGGVTASKGYSGTQFVEDMMTLKIRKRLGFLVKTADKGGFAKVTSISAALTTLAT